MREYEGDPCRDSCDDMMFPANAKIVILLIVLCAIAEPIRGEASSNNSSGNSGLPQAISVQDIGFRPVVDGFRFENYGDNIPTTGLTPVEMQRMFGDRVVAGVGDGKIILTFPATRWMDEANKAMAGGHCEGMAVLSALMYYNKISPGTFGDKAAADLSLQNEMLQREIAYWWTTQVTYHSGAIKVSASPNAVLDTLANAFQKGRTANEWWVMGVYMPNGSGGHSITPFAVKNMSNGMAEIMVYDNNLPWETRAIKIDRKANTWEYNGSTDPNEPYAGNATTESLEVASISSRLEKQDCDFCDDGNNSTIGSTKGSLMGDKHSQVWVDGNGSFLIIDNNSRRIGFIDSGEFVNEIPDAQRTKLRFAGKGNTKLYEIPIGDWTLDFGKGAEKAWIFFPGFSTGIDSQGNEGTVDLSGFAAGEIKAVSRLDGATITLGGTNTDVAIGPLSANSIVQMNAETNALTAILGTPGSINLDTSTICNGEVVHSSIELKDVKELTFQGSDVWVTHSDGSKELFHLVYSKVIEPSAENANGRTIYLELPCSCS